MTYDEYADIWCRLLPIEKWNRIPQLFTEHIIKEKVAERYPRLMQDWNGREKMVYSYQEEKDFLTSVKPLKQP